MKLRIYLAALAACFLFALSASPASAQATRTWVSGVGDDANPCSRTAPCKTFQGAISKTAAGGIINCLDPGGFGTVTITKSLTIDCVGVVASSLNSGINGIIVNDTSAVSPGTAVVRLRNLQIDGGAALGTNGVHFIRGARLILENVTISNQSIAGVNVDQALGVAEVIIQNSRIDGSTSASEAGIRLAPTAAASVKLVLNNVELNGNFRGIDAVMTGTSAGSTLAMTNTRITHSTDNAINVATNANTFQLMIQGSAIDNNLRGIITTGTGALTRIGGSTVTANGTAFSASGGGVLQSYQNNQIDFNNNNGTPLPTATPG